jgi:hypothetical protein
MSGSRMGKPTHDTYFLNRRYTRSMEYFPVISLEEATRVAPDSASQSDVVGAIFPDVLHIPMGRGR